MPKIPETNNRYRNKERLCEDIAFILKADLHYGTKYAVLSEATWVWTEFNGKYKGCEYWSVAAWELQNEPKRLVHEHVIPKKLVIGGLLSLQQPTANSVNELLTSFCVGAVITREEDALLNGKRLRSKMPGDWEWEVGDVWARYTTVGIAMRPRAISAKTD